MPADSETIFSERGMAGYYQRRFCRARIWVSPVTSRPLFHRARLRGKAKQLGLFSMMAGNSPSPGGEGRGEGERLVGNPPQYSATEDGSRLSSTFKFRLGLAFLILRQEHYLVGGTQAPEANCQTLLVTRYLTWLLRVCPGGLQRKAFEMDKAVAPPLAVPARVNRQSREK